MKSLAIFTENLYGGGVEKILQTILRHFDRERFLVTLYSNREEHIDFKLYPDWIEYRHIFESVEKRRGIFSKIIKRAKNKIRLAVYYHSSPRTFYRLFVRRHFDVGIAFIEGYATRILSGAPRAMKKIAWVHTDLENNPWTSVAFRNPGEDSICYNTYDKIVCVSSRAKEVVDSRYGLNSKTVIIHNPIDRELILHLSEQSLPERFEPDCKIRIVTIGSLIQVKGYERLLDCIEKLHRETPDFELIIVGKGVMENELREIVLKNDMQAFVCFAGYQENPYPILRSADIYVCSSYAEGYNTAITEALVLGKAIVSTECSGVREQLGDSEYGVLVKNDEAALFLGLRSMLTDSSGRDVYQHRAFARGKHFGIEESMGQIYDLLQ